MKIEDNDALIVVDVQNDFCPGGALPVPDGDRVVSVINKLINKFHRVVFSRDWHPQDHCSFVDEPEFVDKSWPEHCVQHSPGAEFHGSLMVPLDALVISKGADADVEAYSAFEGDPDLGARLREWGTDRVYVAGLATDYCVKHTVLDARKAGFEVVLVQDACRGVDVPEGSATKAIEAMRAAGVTTIVAEDLL
jgi:nicotinamidase/pyrazinamidase